MVYFNLYLETLLHLRIPAWKFGNGLSTVSSPYDINNDNSKQRNIRYFNKTLTWTLPGLTGFVFQTEMM